MVINFVVANKEEKGGILLCIPVKLKIIALDPNTYNNPIS